MDVKDIVKDYLKKNGYDGLIGNECCCGLDELMPCDGDNNLHCDPAYKHICQRDSCESAAEYCDSDDGDDCYRRTKP